MALGWINPEDYSFNTFLLFERFAICRIIESSGFHNDEAIWRYSMGVALNANPVVMWYLKRRCPECAALLDEIAANAPTLTDAIEIRKAEKYALLGVEDHVLYTTPELMAEKGDFIRGWTQERLVDLADLTGKIVLDVAAGSGRLTCAAAEKAAWVYASEPAGTLREFMRDKISKEGIKNVRVLDGFALELPFPDSTFDIVMSDHFCGGDYDEETAELSRVCKPGGWLLHCPSDSKYNHKLDNEKVVRGWEAIHYIGSYGNDVYCHRKQVSK